MMKKYRKAPLVRFCVPLAALLSIIAMLSPGISTAESLGSLDALSQERFVSLAKNLSAATHYKSVSPAEGLGSLGLDVGLELSSTEIDDTLFDAASDGSFEGDDLILPRLHIHKGLPFGLDVGASISTVADTDISVIGAELRYNLIRGGVLSPSLAVRATYSQLQGFTDVDLNSTGLELTASKGVLMLTPYVGIGIVQTKANPSNVGSLRAETFDQEKLFAGLTMNVGVALTLEFDQTGDYRTYSARAGFRF